MIVCSHCDETVFSALFSDNDLEKKYPFCCHGCLTVSHVLHLKGLDSYYEIKRDTAYFKRRSPIELKSIQYHYLDQEDFLAEFSYKGDSGERTMEFYLEGIHCLACLWLIEKLPDIVSSVKSSKLDLARSIVTVVIHPFGKFSEAARELNHLGYRPHPLKMNQKAAVLKVKEERMSLLRIGVAGAAAGNIMIYAVSLYGGATADFGQVFNALTVFFAIPVLTFSAFPFYQTAMNALRNRTLSIDIPISIALLLGGLMGLYNLILGISENYFDSLTTLVFLLLLSRYFLQKIQEKGLSAQDLHFFYQSECVLVADNFEDDLFKEIHPRYIKTNDILKIRAGEFIPADGEILSGFSYLNNSLLTGESLPQKVFPGTKIFSGTQNIEQDIVFKVEKTQNDTRLGHILKDVENGWSHKSQIVKLANTVSKYFTAAVFFLAVILFLHLWLQGNTEHAFEQAITLLIVTCPCALALAIPLTFTRALSKASEQGIVIKNDEVIEKLSRVETIYLDKTGTITYGQLKITQFQVFQAPSLEMKDIVYNLEKKSRHPVALALLNHFKGQCERDYPVENLQEILGQGASARIDHHFYEINRHGIFEDHQLIATFAVEDVVRDDSKTVLKKLSDQKLKVSMLSGDTASVVAKIAHDVGLPTSQAFSDLSPEQKSELLQNSPRCMMVGDGANDAIALSHASVGVAVMGAMDISLRAADVYLTTPGLAPVEKLIILSRETMKVIRRNLVLSLLYNSLSVIAVFSGFINPLVAAIIMPVSSLTVLLSTVFGTKKLRTLWKS